MVSTPHPDPEYLDLPPCARLPSGQSCSVAGERENCVEPSRAGQAISVTESPWFWVMLFSLAGLAAVFTIGPKFEKREASIEAKFHARERALGREAFEKPSDDAAPSAETPWQPIFTLGPIAAVLMCLAVVGMVNVMRFHRRKWKSLQSNDAASETAV